MAIFSFKPRPHFKAGTELSEVPSTGPPVVIHRSAGELIGAKVDEMVRSSNRVVDLECELGRDDCRPRRPVESEGNAMSETDIVERLRAKSKDFTVSGGMLDGGKLYLEAAAEITRLRESLDEIKLRTSAYAHDPDWPLVSGIYDVADAALRLPPLSDGGER